jgi:Domain of unknown function (DUF4388)
MSLQGNLTDLPLIDIFQIFSVQNKKGILLISYFELCGELYFSETGLWAAFVVSTTYQHERKLISYGEEAIYQIMDWSDGNFRFELNYFPTNLNRNVFVNYNYLILEQCRRRDEKERQKHIEEIAGLIPHLVPNPPAQAEISLTLEEWRILLQVNSSSSVAGIANTTRQPLEEIVRCLDNLASKGLIELTKIAKFVPKTPFSQPVNNDGYTQQPAYYARAVGCDEPPPSNLYNLPSQKWQAKTVTAPAPTTYTKPKVQRGILSGIMAKIRGM